MIRIWPEDPAPRARFSKGTGKDEPFRLARGPYGICAPKRGASQCLPPSRERGALVRVLLETLRAQVLAALLKVLEQGRWARLVRATVFLHLRYPPARRRSFPLIGGSGLGDRAGVGRKPGSWAWFFALAHANGQHERGHEDREPVKSTRHGVILLDFRPGGTFPARRTHARPGRAGAPDRRRRASRRSRGRSW